MWQRCRFPTLFAASILALMVLSDLVFLPWHEKQGGNLTGWINGLARLVELPGLVIAETAGTRFRHHTGWGAWFLMLASSLPLYMILGAVLRWSWCGGKRLAEKTARPAKDSGLHAFPLKNDFTGSQRESLPAPPAPVESLSRRSFFVYSRRVALASVAGTAAYAFLGELYNVETTRQSFRIRGLPPALDGLRIVQLTDIHHGPWTSLNYIRGVIEQTNAMQPDLILLTGDYVHQSEAYIPPVMRELATLRAKIGVIGTLGNHDWWEDGVQCLREFAKARIPLIDNDRLFLTSDRTLERRVGPADRAHALCVAGVGDLWEGAPNYREALAGVPREMPRILLSHNPDVAEEPAFLRQAPRVDLMLSGHTHGGQVSLPLIGRPITPSKYGERYASGLVQSPLCPVYVNRGIGTTIIPMRLRVRPEIALIELRSA